MRSVPPSGCGAGEQLSFDSGSGGVALAADGAAFGFGAAGVCDGGAGGGGDRGVPRAERARAGEARDDDRGGRGGGGAGRVCGITCRGDGSGARDREYRGTCARDGDGRRGARGGVDLRRGALAERGGGGAGSRADLDAGAGVLWFGRQVRDPGARGAGGGRGEGGAEHRDGAGEGAGDAGGEWVSDLVVVEGELAKGRRRVAGGVDRGVVGECAGDCEVGERTRDEAPEDSSCRVRRNAQRLCSVVDQNMSLIQGVVEAKTPAARSQASSPASTRPSWRAWRGERKPE